MADDLARYQGQAAIHARLPGPLQRLQRQARSHPWTTALLGLLGLALLAGGVVIRLMITRLALRQRSQQALTMLARAQDHAADGRHGLADQEFLQAMLVAKGAFLEDPADRGLKDALARIKRSRIAYAETRGNWSLADELRHNLARLEGAPEPSPSEARELPEASIRIHALRPGERVVFHALDGAPGQATIEVSADDPQVRLLPGTYLATHQTREGGLESCHLVVVDAGSDHALRLDQNSQPPPGVFRLPARALRDQLD